MRQGQGRRRTNEADGWCRWQRELKQRVAVLGEEGRGGDGGWTAEQGEATGYGLSVMLLRGLSGSSSRVLSDLFVCQFQASGDSLQLSGIV